MAITSGFFDSVDGDRTYDADQMSNYFDGLVSNGVYENIGDRFIVRSAFNGMNITVGAGRAIIQSHWVKNDATATLTLDPSDVQLNRIDVVVLRLDNDARDISLVVKKGTGATGTPTMPDITRTESVYELYLAAVYISKGASQPTSITDLRPSSYCGWVTGIIQQVDTSDLFNQWLLAYADQYEMFKTFIDEKTAAFNEWFSTLTKDLVVQAGIIKLQHTEWVSASSNSARIDRGELADYNEESDILFVYVDGVFFVEGIDYEQVTISGWKLIRLLNGKQFGRESKVTFIVLRNTPMLMPTVTGDATTIIDGVANSIVGSAESLEV